MQLMLQRGDKRVASATNAPHYAGVLSKELTTFVAYVGSECGLPRLGIAGQVKILYLANPLGENECLPLAVWGSSTARVKEKKSCSWALILKTMKEKRVILFFLRSFNFLAGCSELVKNDCSASSVWRAGV